MVPSRNVVALTAPSSWSGRIPCADCEYIETAVTLYPDGEFRSQGIYHGARGIGDTVFTDFGRWSHTAGGTRLSVRGSADVPGQFVVAPDGALRMLDPDGNEIRSQLNYTLNAVEPMVQVMHPTRLTGAFAMASTGATFTECGSGLQYPVASTGAYAAVAAAYRQSGVASSIPVPVRVRAHLEDGPSGGSADRTIVIDSLSQLDRTAGCAAMEFPAQLAGAPWRLALVRTDNGTLAAPPTSEAEFRWDRTTTRLSGNAGCNRLTGTAALRGTLLIASDVGVTRMQCPEADVMALERSMLEWLASPLALRLSADTLVWQLGPAEVARFVRGS